MAKLDNIVAAVNASPATFTGRNGARNSALEDVGVASPATTEEKLAALVRCVTIEDDPDVEDAIVNRITEDMTAGLWKVPAAHTAPMATQADEADEGHKEDEATIRREMHKEFHAYVPRLMLLARRAGLEIEASNLVEGINSHIASQRTAQKSLEYFMEGAAKK